MMDKFKDYDTILSIDADCRIYSDPTIDISEDISMHYFRNKEYLAGTMYFKNNMNIYKLMKDWEYECIVRPKKRSALILTDIIKNRKIKVQNLDPRYVKIYDIMHTIKNPIIEHFQASRQFRGKHK
jgi:hypothetical protein